jgi:hypothetical protein
MVIYRRNTPIIASSLVLSLSSPRLFERTATDRTWSDLSEQSNQPRDLSRRDCFRTWRLICRTACIRHAMDSHRRIDWEPHLQFLWRLVSGLPSLALQVDFERRNAPKTNHRAPSPLSESRSGACKPTRFRITCAPRPLPRPKELRDPWRYITSDPRSLRPAADTFWRSRRHGPSSPRSHVRIAG